MRGLRVEGIQLSSALERLSGTVIADRFELRDQLGQGGMGTVYRAWQRSVKREVALKLIAPKRAIDTGAMRRFEREALLASQLSHPSIVTVFDYGQDASGRMFIAMELVRGRTLTHLVKTHGALPLDRVVTIGIQLANALEAAHALGVIHRDLKLDNVMVLDDPPGMDRIKVLDFGLAKLAGEQMGVTENGVVVGTFRYLSPEAPNTRVPQPARDVYALGVMLAELATGSPLWVADELSEYLRLKRLLTPVVMKLPAALRPVIRAMIDPDPDKRPTASDARVRLLEALGQHRMRSTAPGVGVGGPRTVRPLRAPPVPAPGASTTLRDVPLPVGSSEPEIPTKLERRSTPATSALPKLSTRAITRPPRRWSFVAGSAAISIVVILGIGVVVVDTGEVTTRSGDTGVVAGPVAPSATVSSIPTRPDASPSTTAGPPVAAPSPAPSVPPAAIAPAPKILRARKPRTAPGDPKVVPKVVDVGTNLELELLDPFRGKVYSDTDLDEPM